jgi:hypothetical protein
MDKLFHCSLNSCLGYLQDLHHLDIEVPNNERPEVFWIPAVLPADICINWNKTGQEREMKKRRKNSKTSPPSSYAASMVLVATDNLINMVAVSAVSGAVLLGLLAVKHL